MNSNQQHTVLCILITQIYGDLCIHFAFAPPTHKRKTEKIWKSPGTKFYCKYA